MPKKPSESDTQSESLKTAAFKVIKHYLIERDMNPLITLYYLECLSVTDFKTFKTIDLNNYLLCNITQIKETHGENIQEIKLTLKYIELLIVQETISEQHIKDLFKLYLI